jgi:hypothetical protein
MKKDEHTLSNNDSPIVVSDTTGIFGGHPKPNSTVAHGNGFGKNAHNRFIIHDKSPGNKDDYRPACLDFSPANKVPIPAGAGSFQINYTDSGGSSGILMTWSENGDSNGDAGDITFGSGFISSGNNITLAVQVVSMDWSIDGGSSTQVQASGPTLVTVHYCPGGKCKDAAGNNPCQ